MSGVEGQSHCVTHDSAPADCSGCGRLSSPCRFRAAENVFPKQVEVSLSLVLFVSARLTFTSRGYSIQTALWRCAGVTDERGILKFLGSTLSCLALAHEPRLKSNFTAASESFPMPAVDSDG